ncbi:hypothetical protein PBY51_002342 [Eleginops maclovinus]|nr:hypothetical protein PBY51_002342 [Eleginops maclovinus]
MTKGSVDTRTPAERTRRARSV